MRIRLSLGLTLLFSTLATANGNFRLDLRDVSHGGDQVYNELTRLFREAEELGAGAANSRRAEDLLRTARSLAAREVGPHFTINGHRYGLFDMRPWRNAPPL